MNLAAFVSDGPVLLAAAVAVAAGLLSFLSPCVLPLVPGYLTFVTGLSGQDLIARGVAEQDRARATGRAAGPPASVPAPGPPIPGSGAVGASQTAAAAGVATVAPTAAVTGAVAGGRSPGGSRWRLGRVTLGTVLFVGGFTAVFVSYGAAFGGLGRWLIVHQVGVSQILGAVTIVMGLAFAGAFSRIGFANREWRIHRLPPPGLVGAPVLGIMFGIGWTPCLGPTLTTVLGLAVQSATAGRGAFLSGAYCLGLGIPFLAVGLAFRRVAGALALVRRHARLLTLTGGVLLIAVGVLQITGGWADLIASLRSNAPGFGETPL